MPSYEQQRDAVVRCGIPAENVVIEYEGAYQSDVIRISDAGQSSDEKWRCLVEARHPFYVLELQHSAQRAAYYDVERREVRKRAKAEGIAWLGERGLLENVPGVLGGSGITAFARSVEEACSIPPGSVLEVHGSSLLTLRRDFFDRFEHSDAARHITCLMHVIAASDASEAGVEFGIIGNAAVAPEVEAQ